MGEWILILFLHATPSYGGYAASVALHSIHGFNSESACIVAGQKARIFDSGKKEYGFVCVSTGEKL